MKLTPIQVESYAGYKVDETPRRFAVGEEWLEIDDVVDRWHQIERSPEAPRADYFKVQAADGHRYLLKHDLDARQWVLVRRW